MFGVSRAIVLLGVALAVVGCETSTTPVPMGIWGGEGVSVNVSGDGAVVTLDCAHGVMNSPLELGSDREFEFPGTMVFEDGGPSDDDVSRTVRFFGELRGDTLEFSILPLDRIAFTPRTFVAVRGKEPTINKCL